MKKIMKNIKIDNLKRDNLCKKAVEHLKPLMSFDWEARLIIRRKLEPAKEYVECVFAVDNKTSNSKELRERIIATFDEGVLLILKKIEEKNNESSL